jgi:hypothetical protein
MDGSGISPGITGLVYVATEVQEHRSIRKNMEIFFITIKK